MSQERLLNLSIITTENEELNKVDMSNIIKRFTSEVWNARKVPL